ncbi:DUF1097 domain-containing protein [Azoarcus olearius]|uniref:Conserved hypothetical membrane protein n=1 Tax=Azoarcus sp. (strain BH72) TaxID=418699 RepID=A1K4S6_AZOSB|nr:DUF1097 domain-containing protein [Azoarcus olearius]CAL93831.1 conserved hypothetical membrane protein [Azoarcus olearius]
MSQLAALSLSIALLGGFATWLFLTVGGVLIWAAFVAWGCYFQAGGNAPALRNTLVCNTFGAAVAWLAAVVILSVPLAATLTLPGWAAVVVFATAWLVCMAANVPALSTIPASFYGYASTFAFLLQTPERMNLAALTSPGLDNAFIVTALSMAIGALFGYVSGALGGALMTRTARAG